MLGMLGMRDSGEVEGNEADMCMAAVPKYFVSSLRGGVGSCLTLEKLFRDTRRCWTRKYPLSTYQNLDGGGFFSHSSPRSARADSIARHGLLRSGCYEAASQIHARAMKPSESVRRESLLPRIVTAVLDVFGRGRPHSHC